MTQTNINNRQYGSHISQNRRTHCFPYQNNERGNAERRHSTHSQIHWWHNREPTICSCVYWRCCRHVHILCTLPKTMALSDFVRSIKANSSRWIKTLGSHYAGFEWQTGYGAFSVSPSVIDKTIDYINNQAEHHKTVSFSDEYKAFLAAYKVEFNPDYLLTD